MAEKQTATVKSSDLEGNNLRHLSVEQVQSLKEHQLSKLTPEQVSSMSSDQMAALSPEQLGDLSPEAQAKLPAEQQTRMARVKASEQLNPQKVDLAPGFDQDSPPGALREKVPHYAPQQAPVSIPQSRRPGGEAEGHGRSDTKVPPENITMSAPSGEPKEGQLTAAPAKKELTANDLSMAVQPEDVGLPRPELKAGQSPLPEEDPTPSTVPIPPPGPRRVA